MKPLLIILLLLTTTINATNPRGVRGAILCEIPNSKRHVSLFINKYWVKSKQCADYYKIPQALILAQMALESGWDRSRHAKNNNMLGIKTYNLDWIQ